MPASEFGPLALKQIRQRMLDNGWSRSTINSGINVIVQAFQDAVADEVVSPEAVTALQCVKPLKRGEAGPEREKVKGVPLADVEGVKPHLSRQAVAIIEVMLLTAARAGEVTIMRAVDIEYGKKVWTYRPTRHKTEHHGRERSILVGPKGQAIIEPYLADRPVTAYLFSQAEAERRQAQYEARKTPENHGNRRGTNRLAEPKRQAGDHYTTDSLWRAIERACKAAGVPTWTPHQLRHTAATEYRREGGVEAAALVLGHASPTMTDAVYAERDYAKAAEVIGRVG